MDNKTPTPTASSNTSNPSSSPSSSYVPGVCNINTAEIAYRRKSGFVLLAITIFLTVPFFVAPLPAWMRLLLFFPLFLTIVCFLQVKYKFCVGYGAAGKQNATEGDKVAQDIVDAAALKLDKDRTRKIKLQAAAAALIISLLLSLLP